MVAPQLRQHVHIVHMMIITFFVCRNLMRGGKEVESGGLLGGGNRYTNRRGNKIGTHTRVLNRFVK